MMNEGMRLTLSKPIGKGRGVRIIFSMDSRTGLDRRIE
jgi:hypothetical protein